MGEYLLGIDIGTSACKIAVFAKDGTVKETGENFFYRIYDRELFLHVMHRLRAVKREKTPAEAKAVLPKCKCYE